ncbi:MAG: hypothetical protein GY861_18585 [bacterium]|nr:hypothetical protein [bacterium]
MLKLVTIKKISRTERVSKKTGKPFTSVGIMVESKEGDKWLNGFGNKVNDEWAEGDRVKIVIKQNGEYWNFETPSAANLLEIRVDALEERIKQLEINEKAH